MNLYEATLDRGLQGQYFFQKMIDLTLNIIKVNINAITDLFIIIKK